MFLTILRKILYLLAPPAAISGAFDYDTVFNTLSNLRVFQPANPSLTTHRTPDHSPGAKQPHLPASRLAFRQAARFELSLEL